MYYPKSKIITDLFTSGGEYVIKENNKEYKGYYHKLYNGKIFSGKNQNDFNVVELILAVENNVTNDDPEVSYSQDNVVYNYLKNININKQRLIPSSYKPTPTTNDYEFGEISRYFIKKINENKITEVDKEDYNSIKGKDPKYLFELFIPFEVRWQIAGNKIISYNINKNTIISLEKLLKFPIIYYFNNKFSYLYNYPIINNFYTAGNELLLNNDNFIGNFLTTKDGYYYNETELKPVNESVELILLNKILKSLGKYIDSNILLYNLANKK